jgi:Na+/melibiose symporter-like transporter
MVGQIGSIVLINVIAGGILTNEAICAKGEISYVVDGVTHTLRGAAYGAQFYNIMVPIVVILSAVYTAMAVAAISSKDKPEFWGISEKPAKFKDYLGIIKENKEIRWLVLSSGFNKLASTVATSGTVAFMLYGCLMGDYNGLFIPFYALCFVFMGLFFLWGSSTAGKKGQKRGVAQFTIFAFIFYIGVLILLCIYNHDNPATYLSLFSTEGGFHLTINAYTVFFIIFYGCGYGAFNCCDQLTIPMVADCTDYETYRSGNYVPGIMGTIFSLVDKIISSLQTLLLQIFIVFLVPGLNGLPAEGTEYMPGMELSTIICFCLLPMCAWLITTFCMTRYGLSGKKLQEIQAVNAVRKAAVKGGMSMEQAMKTWQTIDQVPAAFIPVKKPRINKKTGEVIEEKDNILDKIYEKVFTRREKVTDAPPSSNAIDIPEEYLTDDVREQMTKK